MAATDGKPVNLHEDKLRNITDKIAKALDDIDALYEGHDHEHEIRMLRDLSKGVDTMDSGPLKAQLKVFLNNYQDVSSQLDDIVNERDKVIDTMAKFMEHSHFDPEVSDDNPPKDSTINYKMLFGKIKRINDEIRTMKAAGGDVAALKREKEVIQKQAIKEFEKQQRAAISQEAETIIKVDHSAWKFAAGEIVSLLQKTRDGGAAYIAELEVRIKDFIKEVEDCNLQNQKYRAQIAELRAMERKWKEHYMRLTKERVKAEKGLRKCQAELKETRKILRGYIHDLPGSQFDKDEAEDANISQKESTDKSADDIDQAQDALKEINSKLEKITNQLNETRKLYSDMRKKASVAEKKVAAAERKLKQREERIDELEIDKRELMMQMDKSLLRPDTRRLSVAIPLAQEYPFLDSIGEAASIGDLPDYVVLPCKKCKCTCQTSKDGQAPQVIATTSAANVKATKEDNVHKTRQQSQCNKCRGLMKQLERQVDELSSELAITKDKPKATQGKTNEGGKESKSTTPSSEVKMNQHHPKHPKSQRKNAPVPPPSPQAVEAEFIHLADSKKGSTTTGSQSPERSPKSPRKETGSGTRIAKSSSSTIRMKSRLNVLDVCVQTDPHLDPLSQWSPVVTNQDGWRPPVPPANWVDFDPTPACSSPVQTNVMTEKRETVGDSMKKGTDPSNIRRKSMFMADFMKRETERMIQGIQGFLDFANTMVGGDITEMENTNNKLKSYLPSKEQKNIDSMLIRPPSSDLAGNPWKTPDDSSDKKGVKDCFNEIKTMGATAMKSLRQAYNNFYNSLHTQHREYEQIYSKIQELPKEQLDEAFEKENPKTKSKFELQVQMPEIPHLTSERAAGGENVQTKSGKTASGLPAIDNMKEKPSSMYRLSDPNLHRKDPNAKKKKGVVQLTVFSKEERKLQEKKANASHVPLSLLSGTQRTMAARSKWGDKKKAVDNPKGKESDPAQTRVFEVLGSFLQDYTPDDINKTLDSYAEKAIQQEKKKMIEAKTEMWAGHSAADNLQILNAVAKSNPPYSTTTAGNNLTTAPMLPPLHGTALSPAVVQQ